MSGCFWGLYDFYKLTCCSIDFFLLASKVLFHLSFLFFSSWSIFYFCRRSCSTIFSSSWLVCLYCYSNTYCLYSIYPCRNLAILSFLYLSSILFYFLSFMNYLTSWSTMASYALILRGWFLNRLPFINERLSSVVKRDRSMLSSRRRFMGLSRLGITIGLSVYLWSRPTVRLLALVLSKGGKLMRGSFWASMILMLFRILRFDNWLVWSTLLG